MSIERKLQEWQAAGLVDAATRERIASFERERARPVLLYALGGLGAFTVGLGVISMVAANWDGLGKLAKLTLDFLVGAGLAAGLYWARSTGRAWQTDVLAGISYVFTLASLALLGQIYQTGAPIHQALLFWSAITLPMMLLVQGRLLGLTWLSGLASTHVLTLVAWLDPFESRYSGELMRELACTSLVLSWLAYVLVARIPWFARGRPLVARAWSESLWLVFLVGTLFVSCAFYTRIDPADRATWGAAVAVSALLGLAALLPRLYAELPLPAVQALRAGLALSSLVIVLGTAFSHGELPLVAALLQVALLCAAAFALLKLGSVRAFNSLTGLVALRLLVMYFEVFGSLLDTGLGMISGGLLTLFLAWTWKRKSPELAARLQAGTTVPRSDHAV